MYNIIEIQSHFTKNNGVLTTKMLKEFGISQYQIKKLLEQEIIERIKRGNYTLYDLDINEKITVQRIIPKGVFCLLSAAEIYEYTTNVPSSYHIAIRSNQRPSLPSYPQTSLFYWSKSQFELGLNEMKVDESYIRVYDKEKTVCDFIKFRNKNEMSVVKEVIKSYLKDPKRNIPKLVNYSEKLRIRKVLKNYLEILL